MTLDELFEREAARLMRAFWRKNLIRSCGHRERSASAGKSQRRLPLA